MASRKVAGDLSSMIRSHAEERTLEELAAQGKRRVRVVSRQKVMQVIRALADDTNSREPLEQALRNPECLTLEIRQHFDRVMAIQAEHEAVVREQSELARKFREQAESASERIDDLNAQLEAERDEWAEKELTIVRGYREKVARLQQELAGRGELADAESQRRIAELEEARDDARRREEDARELILVSERTLNRTEARLAAMEAAGRGQESEVRRLSDRIDDTVADAAKRETVLTRRYEERIAALQEENRSLLSRVESEQSGVAADLRKAEQEAGHVGARLATASERIAEHEESIERLGAELAEAHRRIGELVNQRDEARDTATEAEAAVRRAERKLRRMQVRQTTARSQLAERERDVERLTDEIAEADAAVPEVREQGGGPATEMRERPNRIAETEKEDRPAVVVERIFDDEHEMASNLDSLEVEEVAAEGGVTRSIARLRATREGEMPSRRDRPGGDIL